MAVVEERDEGIYVGPAAPTAADNLVVYNRHWVFRVV